MGAEEGPELAGYREHELPVRDLDHLGRDLGAPRVAVLLAAARADPRVAREPHHEEVAALGALVVQVAVGEVVAAHVPLDGLDEPGPPEPIRVLALEGRPRDGKYVLYADVPLELPRVAAVVELPYLVDQDPVARLPRLLDLLREALKVPVDPEIGVPVGASHA